MIKKKKGALKPKGYRAGVLMHGHLHRDLAPYIQRNPKHFAFWVGINLLSASKCAGGVIEGGASIDPMDWVYLGVTHGDVASEESELWRIEGDDLIIEHYDHEAEDKYLNANKRASYARNARKKKASPPSNVESDEAKHPSGASRNETGRVGGDEETLSAPDQSSSIDQTFPQPKS